MNEEEVTRIIDNIQLRLVAEKVGGIETRTKDEILLIKCIQELQQENKQLKEENERLKDIVSVPNIEIDKDLLITKANLIHWLDRTPTDDDKDLCDYLATAVKNQYQYKIQINNLNSILTELEEWLKEQEIEYPSYYWDLKNKIQKLKEKYK